MIKKLLRKMLHLVDNNDEIAVARSLGVRVGDGCVINDNARKVFNTEPYLITLGNNVTIASDVRFITHDGAIGVLRCNEDYKDKDLLAPIVVGNNVFIGIRSIILPGVHIGDNVIIGAHSLVVKDIPNDTVAAGSPAKPICTIKQFSEKLRHSKKMVVPTKGMSAEQKKEYLYENFPEWFNI